MNTRLIKFAALVAVLSLAVLNDQAVAQPGPPPPSFVEQNSNVVGVTPPGYYRGMPGMQDNEPSCAFNPLLVRNIVCAWNASGGANDLIQDTWIRFSESLDGGKTFFSRYLTGSPLVPSTSNGQQFAADPVTLCWPGGCGVVMLASTRGETGGVGGGIYMQLMMDMNTESEFRKFSKAGLDQVFRSTGSHFADKPHAIYMLDQQNPGTVEVSMTIEKYSLDANGNPVRTTQFVTRNWPKARILVVFALFNPSKEDIQIMSMFTDTYGANWSNAKQVAVTSGRDQGVSVSAIDNVVFYGFRRFSTDDEPSAMMGAVSTNRGGRILKPFEVVAPLCAYDVPTLPNEFNTTAAAARTNDFPSVSNDGKNFIMVYSERQLSSVGDGCLTDFTVQTDSRIMAVVGSPNGKTWGTPVEVASNPGHGFQFMPAVDCSLGFCQIAWVDTKLDTERNLDFLNAWSGPSVTALTKQAAIDAFLLNPLFADFNFPIPNSNDALLFHRTADLFTKKVRLQSLNQDVTAPAVRASHYRLGLVGGKVVQREFNPWHIKSYKDSSVPFMSDYIGMTSVKQRLVIDLTQPENRLWEDNASPANIAGLDEDPLFWLSWVDARNLRGQIFTSKMNGKVPFNPTKPPVWTPTTVSTESQTPATQPDIADQETLTAENVEDFDLDLDWIDCVAGVNPGPGDPLPLALFNNNRTKDFDIYGVLIENKTTAWSYNPTKTFGLDVQRAFTIVIENAELTERTFRLEIANQPLDPTGDATKVRASWEQLPFEPPFPLTAPEDETVVVDPQSSAALALFVYSQTLVNPVSVNVFEVFPGGSPVDKLINVITLNGTVEAGVFLDLNSLTTGNVFEIHNPVVFTPDQFNPDQFNPDQYNPDQFNPDLFNPDQFNPDQFNPDQYNPDQFNPDQFNPDQYNPDQFNPDQFNPDQFNPDQYNPDQFNLTLTDSSTFDNPEIPNPGLGSNLVVKLDITYGMFNDGNTLTPYTVDFAITDQEVLALLADDAVATQLIVWQDKQVDDIQFCTPKVVTENRVIAVVNNPDLTTFIIPDIDDNRLGLVTFLVASGDTMQLTIRIIAPPATMALIAPLLGPDVISYVFASQVANTSNFDLGLDETEINDLQPPVFNFSNGDITAPFEATSPSGALIPAGLVTASKEGANVTLFCDPNILSGTTVVGVGLTPLHCEATSTDNGVTATLDMSISVVDSVPPVLTIEPPATLIEATSAAGAVVSFTATATDFGEPIGVTCRDSDGAIFDSDVTRPIAPARTVDCITDADGGDLTAADSFTFTVEDTNAPVLTIEPPATLIEATSAAGAVVSFTATATDFGEPIGVTCRDSDGAIFDSDVTRPIAPARTVNCITDADGGDLTAADSFTFTVEDTRAPVVKVVQEDITVTLDDINGKIVDFVVTFEDIDLVDPNPDVTCTRDSGSLFPPGTTTVTCSATDSSGNTSDDSSFVVTLQFGTGVGIFFDKGSIKAGSVVPLSWEWKDSSGMNIPIGIDKQDFTIVNSDGNVVFFLSPGSSGFRLTTEFVWVVNWQTVIFVEEDGVLVEVNLPPGVYRANVNLLLPDGSVFQTQISPLMTIVRRGKK